MRLRVGKNAPTTIWKIRSQTTGETGLKIEMIGVRQAIAMRFRPHSTPRGIAINAAMKKPTKHSEQTALDLQVDRHRRGVLLLFKTSDRILRANDLSSLTECFLAAIGRSEILFIFDELCLRHFDLDASIVVRKEVDALLEKLELIGDRIYIEASLLSSGLYLSARIPSISSRKTDCAARAASFASPSARIAATSASGEALPPATSSESVVMEALRSAAAALFFGPEFIQFGLQRSDALVALLSICGFLHCEIRLQGLEIFFVGLNHRLDFGKGLKALFTLEKESQTLWSSRAR